MQSISREDDETRGVAFVAWIVLSIGKTLTSAKTSWTLDDIDELVDSGMSQIIREIYKEVKKWEGVEL